jgi:low temperature requirement protein LtrA
MLRTVVITGAISFAIFAVIILLTVSAGAALNTEYLEFALALAMLLVILAGSYFFVVRGPGRRM